MEFGGLLIGRYVDNKKMVIIEDTVLPKKYKSSKYSFERGVTGLRKVLKIFFTKSPSLIYVGEWHTHPDNPAIPSVTDINALKQIANHNEVFIDNPILLIIRIGKKDYELGFYVLYENKICNYKQEGIGENISINKKYNYV
jgi:integrative and conjugative element protein (TIGR02256 family)